MRSFQISEEPGVFHADGYDGTDYTLCGTAFEGVDGDAEVTPSTRRINCPKCVAIILAAKRYKSRDFVKDAFHD